MKRFLNRGHEAEDLFQVGCIGLIKAIDKFDMSYNVQFSTYAVPMITGEIKRFIRDDGIIKVSRSIKELGIKVRGIRESFCKKNGREPTVTEIADAAQATVEDVVMALDAYSVPESLNAESNSERPLEERICGTHNSEEEILDNISLKAALSTLKPRERQIIVMRYFMDKTQAETAKRLGISQVQVSRLEKKVLLKMREELES